jgi:hypothetical protein
MGWLKRIADALLKGKKAQEPTRPKNGRKDVKREHKVAPAIQRRREKIVLNVGLDFGTSATKVMFSQARRRGVWPVTFDHGLKYLPDYCLPSLVAIDSKKHFVFGSQAARVLRNKPWDHGIRRLKVLVAGEHDERFRDQETEQKFKEYTAEHFSSKSPLTPKLLTALYLAYVMNMVRQKITQRAEYANHELDFLFNMCIPIDYAENNPVRAGYEEVLAWAELIEREWPPGDWNLDGIERAKELRSRANYGRVQPVHPGGDFGREDPQARVFAVPETVAEVASYLVSLRKREGLHAIIDLGAGTTDVSVFNLRNTAAGDQAIWYSARCIPRGVTRIERIINAHLENSGTRGLCKDADVIALLRWLSEGKSAPREFAHLEESLRNSVRGEVEQLWRATHEAWGEAYGHLRQQTFWERDKVQVFVCGGGCRLPGVEYWFSKSWMDVHAQAPERHWGPYRYDVLPAPEEFNIAAGVASFPRLAVAYGLTLPLPALGKFILPSSAPDHTPPPMPRLKIRWREDWDAWVPTNWV